MISLSLAQSRDPAHQRSFAPYALTSVGDLLHVVTAQVWSPLIWRDGLRTKTHFLSSCYMALDFDAGPSLAEVEAELRGTEKFFVIGTTKSHQKAKVSPSGKLAPPCDRFRVIFKAKTVCTSRELYEYNMALLISYFGADKSCTDAARFFFPCVQVVSWQLGDGLAWLPFDADYVPEGERYAARAAKLARAGAAGIMPKWVADILSGAADVHVGERHKTCYRLGATLAAMGIGEEKIICLVRGSRRLREIGDLDLDRAVKNGIAAELGK